MRRLLAGILVGAFALSASSYAYAAERKVAYVNVEKLLSEYKRHIELRKGLQDKINVKKAEHDKKVEEITKLKDEIGLLSSKAKEKKQALLDEKEKDLKAFDIQAGNELGRQQDEMHREVSENIRTVTESYAKSNNYDIIYDARSLFYAPENLDITDELLKLLNK